MAAHVVVTGMGAVSSLGIGTAALWAGIQQGRDGRVPIRRFSTEELTVHQACMVPGFNPPPETKAPQRRLSAQFAAAAGAEAMLHAGVAASAIPAERMAVVLGTNLVIEGEGPQSLATQLASDLGIRGPCLAVATACAASTGAIALARDLVASGIVDLAVAGGTDALTRDVLGGFHALGVLSAGWCAPFSEPAGTVLGEGAAFVVLERAEHAARRGAEALAGLWGYGLSSDAYHETSPDPAGAGLARAVRAALADAGLPASAIGYINVHGTGTEANDAAESHSLRAVFGSLAGVPVSSSKSFLGHALGAAGSLELVTSLLALRRQEVPPTLHVAKPRAHAPPDLVSEGRPRAHVHRHALSTSAAFGGVNAVAAFGLPSAAPEAQPEVRRPVFVLGIGVVGEQGLGVNHLARALATGERRIGRVGDLPTEPLLRSADPRRLDPSTRFLCAAAARALEDAGAPIRGPARDRSGLIVGSSRLSPATSAEFLGSIDERGLARLSSAAFARRVLCAPAGSCSRLLSLRGPTSTLATGIGSGLAAMAYAAHVLGTRDDADLMVTGGFDELGAGDPADRGEGASCAVLGTPAPGAMRIQVLGWGLAGPGDTAAAAKHALEVGGVAASEVEVVFGAKVGENVRARRVEVAALLGEPESSGACFALAGAVLALREGSSKTALVTTAGGTASVALVIRRMD